MSVTASAIRHERIVGKRVPQAGDGIVKLACATLAFYGRQVIVQAKIEGCI